jgi:hypothetical protein
MFDAPTFGTLFMVSYQFAFEVAGKFAAQETHDIVGGEAVDSVVEQVGHDSLQTCSIPPHDVSRNLTFVDHPVVTAASVFLHVYRGELAIDALLEHAFKRGVMACLAIRSG